MEHDMPDDGGAVPEIAHLVVVLRREFAVEVGRRSRPLVPASLNTYSGVTTAFTSPHGSSRRCNFVVGKGRWRQTPSVR